MTDNAGAKCGAFMAVSCDARHGDIPGVRGELVTATVDTRLPAVGRVLVHLHDLTWVQHGRQVSYLPPNIS